MMKLTEHDYQLALDAQNACNLSGIVHSWSKIVSRIWDEAHERGEGTDWVNKHPINVLFAAQASWLCAGDSIGMGVYGDAHRDCECGARGEVLRYFDKEVVHEIQTDTGHSDRADQPGAQDLGADPG